MMTIYEIEDNSMFRANHRLVYVKDCCHGYKFFVWTRLWWYSLVDWCNIISMSKSVCIL